jgi:hypothetical protein
LSHWISKDGKYFLEKELPLQFRKVYPKETPVMITRSIIKPTENLRGVGEVFLKGRLVTRVSYNLDVLQEEPLDILEEPSSVLEDLNSTVGIITVIEKRKQLHGTDILTLRLNDNRCLDFDWRRSDPVHPKYSIRSRGDFH